MKLVTKGTRLGRVFLIATLPVLLIAASCSAATSTVQGPDATPSPTAQSSPTPPDGPAPDTSPVAPVPYVPDERPGTADAYAALIRELETHVPAALRDEVPWPDTRHANPVVAQTDIFELWIWMAANHPDPRLVAIMAAPNSPSREEVTGIFGAIDRANVFETREGQGYEAFDHRVVTLASAGLPLWLSRGVPSDAVVLYYTDRSGPVTVTDQESGAVLETQPGVAARTWLSVMVPTDVGWQLWLDQLIDPRDNELEVPDVPPMPGADDRPRSPEL